MASALFDGAIPVIVFVSSLVFLYMSSISPFTTKQLDNTRYIHTSPEPQGVLLLLRCRAKRKSARN